MGIIILGYSYFIATTRRTHNYRSKGQHLFSEHHHWTIPMIVRR